MGLAKDNKSEELKAFNHWLPHLILDKAHIEIEIDKYHERPNISDKAIYFIGNIPGFLSIREIINYCANEFIDLKLNVTELPFVKSNMQKALLIEFCDVDEQDKIVTVESSSGIVFNNDENIIWKLSWPEVAQIVQSIHGFKYKAWDHLHFDSETKSSDYSIVFTL